MSDEPLITIGEASKMLGVSEPALRAWTDEGEVKAFVTPGGHRRYLKSDLKKFIGQIQQQSSVKQLTDQLEGTAPVHRKIDEMFFQSNSGPTIHDDTWQDRFASLGRQLLALLTQCVTRPSKPEETISTAKDIGRQFGELTLELGVPLIDSMRAFVQHRDPVLKAIFDLRKNGEASERQIADAVPLVNRAMDEALVAMTAVRMSSR